MQEVKQFCQKKKSHLSVAVLSLVISILIFVSFGLFHLTKSETTDEHFWKHDRIEKYYNGLSEGIKDGRWNKTRLNDKPGVTVALISGVSVPLFGTEPSRHEKVETKNKKQNLYDEYHIEETESLNFALRLPGLLFNALIVLPLIFWLTLKITRNKTLTAFVVLLMGTNPVLIGISQVVNPDTFLWGFSTIGILAYIGLLYRKEKKFIFIAGISTGMALLSKYTANLLFLFYPAIFVLISLFESRKNIGNRGVLREIKEYYSGYAKSFTVVGVIALAVFVIFMPAVFHDAGHFLYGTFYSPTLAPIVDMVINVLNVRGAIFVNEGEYKTGVMFFLSLVIFLFLTIVLPFVFLWGAQKLQRLPKLFLKSLLLLMFFLFVFSFMNAWLGTPFFSLDNLKESSRVRGELVFPSFSGDFFLVFWWKALSVQAQNLIFSLTPITVMFTLFLWIRVLQGKVTQKKLLPVVHLFSSVIPLVFFVGALSADIFVNVRYSLLLFPLFSFLGGLGLYEVVQLLYKRDLIFSRNKMYCLKYVVMGIIVLAQLVLLWGIRPHYFNYHSALLPSKYLVTDSWGYGGYEAAEYLNSLPDSKSLVVWTDHRGLCQFLQGKCIVSKELYLDKTDIDYFVFSRRGMIVKSFVPIGLNPYNITMEKYHSEKFLGRNTVFEVQIGGRPANFVKVIKVEK